MSDGAPDTEIKAAPTMPIVKPGYRTTEAWLTAFSAGVATLYGVGVFGTTPAGIDRIAAFICAALAVGCYSVSRAFAKRG